MNQKEIRKLPDNELLKLEREMNDILVKVCDKNICNTCPHNDTCNTWSKIYDELVIRGFENQLKDQYREE